jgi:phosphoglycolate phosphatase
VIFVERSPGIAYDMYRLKLRFRIFLRKTRNWLAGFSFRTGLIVLGVCALFYILSFAQMLLPISAALKGTLWFWLFGFAKLFQYAGLAIVGVEGVKRLKMRKKLKEEAEK